MRFGAPEAVREEPTAVHRVGETHDTPRSRSLPVPGLGLATTDHLLPFHDSTSVRDALEWSPYEPTATQVPVEAHDTPASSLCPVPGLGLGLIDQVRPFHDSTSVFET